MGPRCVLVQRNAARTQCAPQQNSAAHCDCCERAAVNVTRGSSGPLTARGLETGYGAAKVLLAGHLIAMGIAAIPAEHWPL